MPDKPDGPDAFDLLMARDAAQRMDATFERLVEYVESKAVVVQKDVQRNGTTYAGDLAREHVLIIASHVDTERRYFRKALDSLYSEWFRSLVEKRAVAVADSYREWLATPTRENRRILNDALRDYDDARPRRPKAG